MTLVSDWIETQVPQRFSCSQTSMRQRGKMRQNLWVRTLGPLNAPIQSEAVCDVSESDFNLKSSQRACDWIGTSKGPNLGIHRFSHIRLHLFTRLFPSHLFVWEKTSGLQGRDTREMGIENLQPSFCKLVYCLYNKHLFVVERCW